MSVLTWTIKKRKDIKIIAPVMQDLIVFVIGQTTSSHQSQYMWQNGITRLGLVMSNFRVFLIFHECVGEFEE